MIPNYIFTGISAIMLATVAGYFSIIGLGSLFSASFISVVIMGISIEISKIATAFWLHKNWGISAKPLVLSLCLLVVMAMTITSGGVYGYLSKGHLDQQNPIIDTKLRIKRIDQQILMQDNIINSENKRLKQLDNVVQTLIDFDKISGVDGARSVRALQMEERNEIQNSINGAYIKKKKLNDIKLPLQQGISQIEIKLGPVKYLALLFNSDIRSTIIYFTLLIVLLLDPFAILLVLATSISYNRKIINKSKTKQLNNNKSPKVVLTNYIKKEKHNIPNNVTPTDDLDDITNDELTEFLEDLQVQDALIDDPDLLQEVSDVVELHDNNKDEHLYKYGATEDFEK